MNSSPRLMQSQTVTPVVCQLVHGLPVGGAEVLVSRMVRCLSDRYRFVVACLDEIGELGEMLVAEGIEVVPLGRRPGFDWKCIRRLGRLLREKRVDLVHAHQYTPFAYALATSVFGRRPPVLLTEHGRFFPDYPNRKHKWFNRVLASSRDRYVAVGNSVRQALVDNEGLPAQRVEVVFNGVDPLSLKVSSAQRHAVRAQLDVADDDFVVLNVARLDSIKDHPTAVRAIEIASRRNPAIHLLIAGDGPEKSAIERVIHDLHLASRIKLLGQRSDVADVLAAADVFLLTSVSEGIPVTVLEAMASGVPVIATKVGGLPELVIDGKTGLLAPAGDAACIADALLHLSENSEMRAELAAQAKLRLESDFSESKMIASYDCIYKEMLPAKARGAKPIQSAGNARRGERTSASDMDASRTSAQTPISR